MWARSVQSQHIHATLALTAFLLATLWQAHYDIWLSGLRVVVARLRAVGTHAYTTASAAAVDTSQHSFCFYTSPADAACGLAAGASSVRLPLNLALPPPDRPPGDLLAWGAAQRAAPAHSSRSGLGGAEDCWQHSTVPAVPGFNAALDVHRAAVGRKHGALVTATGVLYTWGEGRGGKLGLGHDQDRSRPARLTQGGLGGQCVVAVACGDDCTAAITASGTLYMWGWLPGASTSRSLLVPGLVRGGLAGKRVVQVRRQGSEGGAAGGGTSPSHLPLPHSCRCWF